MGALIADLYERFPEVGYNGLALLLMKWERQPLLRGRFGMKDGENEVIAARRIATSLRQDVAQHRRSSARVNSGS
jgi:hypothetical protein